MNSSKKLIYIANLRLPTEKAHGIQIAKMCEALTGQGIKVKVVAPFRFSRIKTDFFKYYGVNRSFAFKKIFSPDFYLPGKLNWVAFQIKNFISAAILAIYVLVQKPDIIYSRDELPLYLLSFFKKHLVFEIHKFSTRKLLFYRRFKKLNLKIIAVSRGNKEELLRLGFREYNIVIAHDGVDLKNFDLDIDKKEAREKLGLPQDKVFIGYIGQLKTMGMEKGIGILIKAFKMINLLNKDLMLVIVGGREEDLREYESSENILFLGHKPYNLIPHCLKAFDILAMPFPYNQHYAFYMSPLKLFEYMASRRPIVTTDLPSIREILNEKNSVLVKPENSKNLADGIKFVLENKSLAENLANQAFQDVKSYTWQKRAEMILEFIKK